MAVVRISRWRRSRLGPHRNFPEKSWAELGLLRSEDGDYFDPESGMFWTPDPEGRRFVGRRDTEDDDLSQFRQALPGEGVLPVAEPEGFVIQDPISGETDVVVEGGQPPEEGYGHWLVWADAAGQLYNIPAENISAGGGVINHIQILVPNLATGGVDAGA